VYDLKKWKQSNLTKHSNFERSPEQSMRGASSSETATAISVSKWKGTSPSSKEVSFAASIQIHLHQTLYDKIRVC